jgi:hypothetical protein
MDVSSCQFFFGCFIARGVKNIVPDEQNPSYTCSLGPYLCFWQYLVQIALRNIEVYVLCVCEILQNTILGPVVTSSLTGTHV